MVRESGNKEYGKKKTIYSLGGGCVGDGTEPPQYKRENRERRK